MLGEEGGEEQEEEEGEESDLEVLEMVTVEDHEIAAELFEEPSKGCAEVGGATQGRVACSVVDV